MKKTLTVLLVGMVVVGLGVGTVWGQMQRPTVAAPDKVMLSVTHTNVGNTNLGKGGISRRVLSTTSVSSVSLAGGNRLVAMQYTDGSWGWPLTAPPTYPNIIGPIAMGLAQAYQQTGNAAQRTALINAGAYLLTKDGNFSPSDGYLAAVLDRVLGVTTYTAYVKEHFYDMLASGTYQRITTPSDPTLYTTATYVARIRTSRSGDQANMAAWDIGMGLVGAASCGASTADWIAGVEAEINELDGTQYYDVIGLAGAVYGLAFVGEDFDPTAGQHAAASNLNDLAAILASYQLSTGGFTWNSQYVIENDGNEANQETAYAILALNQVNRTTYLSNIHHAADYLMSVQLGTGGWDDYPGDPAGENNELTGEALWGISVAYPAPVHNVDKDVYYPTIQGAVNDASAGNTILVAAGTYYEHNITINKSLTLTGDPGDAQPGPGPSAPVVDGQDLYTDAFLIANGTSNVTIQGFEIRNYATIHSGANGEGNAVQAWVNGTDHITVTDNYMHNLDWNGVLVGNDNGIAGHSYWTVARNILTDFGPAAFSTSGYGLEVDDASHVVIEDNVVDAGSGHPGCGILIHFRGTYGEDFVIQRNQIRGQYDFAGINVQASTEYTNPSHLDNVNILNNDVEISGSAYAAVQIRNKLSGTVTNTTVHDNRLIHSGGYGARNWGVAETINASGNWFGDNSPSGVASKVDGDVDYTPWLNSGTDADLGPGFQGDFSNLWVSAASPQVGSTTRIQEGIDLVTGSTVNVVAGTYVENVNINKTLNLLGAGAASTTIDGNGAGNCISLAANGVTIDGFTLTNGYNGIQGETKNSTIRNCIIHTNKNWIGSNGVGISLWGDNDNNTISNNSIYDNDRQGVFIGYSDATRISTGNKIVNNTIYDNGKYTLGGDPDRSLYGIQLLIADENLIEGNTIYNHQAVVGWTFAVGVYLDGSKLNTVAGNTIHDNAYNVAVYNGTITGSRAASGNKIQANTLLDPGTWSVKVFSDAPTTYVNFNVFSTATTSDKYVANGAAGTLNAEWNWFGGEAPPGASDFFGMVDYTNYFSTSMTVSVIPSVYYLPLDGTVDVPVMALVPAGTYVRGTDVTLSWDNDTNIPDQSGPTQGSFFTAKVGVGQSEFYDYDPHTVVNTVRVNQGLLGGSTGAGNASIPYVGVLFTMNYKGVAAGTSNLTLSSVQVRDVNNNDITPVVIQNGQLVCDASVPSVTSVLIDNTTLDTDENGDTFDDYVKNTDNVTVTATVTDDHTLTTADIFADLSGFYGGSGHMADNPSSYLSNVATWTVSGVNCSPADGTITVNVLARDVAGNEGTGSDDIIADNTAPTAATNLVAKTISPNGHEQVDLSWTNGTDTHLKGTLIRYKGWGYPTYSGSAPAYPATPTGGDGSATPAPVLQPAHTVTHAIAARDIYSYSAFAVDWAGNYASYDASASDRSANYYLGDLGSGGGTYIPGDDGYDGQVNFDDLFWFSRLYFSTAPGWTSLDPNAAESDFGPTVANKTYTARHRFALPDPDGIVDFEDLMIFAMNYMNVAPKLSPPAETKPATEFALELGQQMTNSEEMVVTVHLSNDGRSVKGTSVVMRFDPMYVTVKEVSGGSVFGPVGQMAFFAHKEGSGTIQMDAAALGVDRTVDYSGDIGTIRFKVLKSGETGLRFDGVKVRNGENEDVGIQTKVMEGVSTTVPLPTTYGIAQNYPNPFNPTTTIAYQVPEVAHVTLEVYNVLGERVATLVDEQQTAGYYRVEWNGKDSDQRSVSSGVYYYRMSAGQFTSIKKMLLVK
jgi:parallel beta-helix repeat protein